MYTDVTEKFKELMTSNRGHMSSELYIEEYIMDTILSTRIEDDSIISIDYTSASSSEQIRVGSFVLPSMTVKVKWENAHVDFTALKGKTMKWHILLGDETMEHPDHAHVCSLKISKVSPKKNGEAVTITAESQLVGKIDKLYIPTISMPASSHAVLDDISDQLGVTINHDRVYLFRVPSIPQYATYRDVLCSIAEYYGLFVSVSRSDNEIFFIWYGTSLHQGVVQTVSKNCCSVIELSTADEGYNGLVCPTGGTAITVGSAPFLTLENKIGLFTVTPARVEQIVERIADIRCRTGHVDLALGNILYDNWDMLKFVPDERHNLITCSLASTVINGVSIERNRDGSYVLNGVATAEFTIDFQTNDIPYGAYNFIENIVDPDRSLPASGIWWKFIQTYEGRVSVTYIDYGTVSVPRNDGYSTTLAVTVFEGAVFQYAHIYPMLTSYDDDYDEWEEYKPDELFPACQIDHHYDGGLKTVITIPEITQNNEGTVDYSSSSEQISADLVALAQQIASKADSVTVSQLAATVATKADAATVGSQIADLDRRVTALEQGGGGSGGRSAVLQTAFQAVRIHENINVDTEV